jgi:TatA/E family protein of Tat protein translocase
MGILQPWHLIIVLVIVLVVFGPGKLPQLGKAVGDSLRDFKKAVGPEASADSTIALEPGMRLCTQCRKPTSITGRFCGECGARTEVPAA